jgi:hypothetical protein
MPRKRVKKTSMADFLPKWYEPINGRQCLVTDWGLATVKIIKLPGELYVSKDLMRMLRKQGKSKIPKSAKSSQ